MRSPWIAWPEGSDPRALRTDLRRAQEDFLGGHRPRTTVREVVLDSWRRAVSSGLDVAHSQAPIMLDDDALEAYREQHPLASVMPVVRRLLVEAAVDADLIVAVGDAEGRLLWVEGAHGLRSRAESMNFVPGASWNERHVGTNAPGTALAIDHAVQVFAGEHFSQPVQPWSCSAAPVHDPGTGDLLGVIDLTGGDLVAAPHTLALVQASVAAVEAELRLAALQRAHSRRHRAGSSVVSSMSGPSGATGLQVLGRDHALLHLAGGPVELGLRHSELLLLLAEHPAGVTAEELAVLISEHELSAVTVRAELTRLRRVVGEDAMSSRPYRLRAPLDSDVAKVRGLLARGFVRRALDAAPGPILPRSSAPGIVALRDDLRAELRSSVLSNSGADLLEQYARAFAADDDPQVWQAMLATSRPSTPRWNHARARLARIEAESGLRTPPLAHRRG